MKPPRFTVRRLVAYAALAGVASAAEVGLWLRAERLRYIGCAHHEKAFMASAESSRLKRLAAPGGELAGCSALRAALEARRAAYHSALAKRYGYAADHPWLPVAPDPPEPE